MAVDCVIIGGGIIGMMTARELVTSGLTVRLLERGLIGREASWAGGGILSPLYPWNSPEDIWSMVICSQEIYPVLCEELFEETGIDPQWIRSGLINFDRIDTNKLTNWAERTGTNFSILDAKQITELEPACKKNFDSAILLPDVAQIRNPRLLKALEKSLIHNGVQIQEGTEVLSILEQNGKVKSVKTSEGNIDCRYVVVAAGAWSGRFLNEKIKIEPVRGQMLLVDVLAGLINHILLRDDVYLIPRNDGQLLIGSTLEYVGFEKGTTQKAADKLSKSAMQLVPSIKEYSITRHWSGLRPGSEQGKPVIKESEQVAGLFINTGHFRNGLILAPVSCKLIADLILKR